VVPCQGLKDYAEAGPRSLLVIRLLGHQDSALELE
jgi:hypothetical protein